MAYMTFSTEIAADNYRDMMIAKGYRSHVVKWNSQRFEVRTWI